MSDNKITTSKSQKASDAPPTRRRRLLGVEIGLGGRLREARGSRKQTDIADQAEIARSALARYEKGERYPSVPEFRRLCDALKTAPEYLLYGDVSPGFTPSESPISAAAPMGNSEEDEITKAALTSILLSLLPRNEREAFREIIWADASRYLKNQPDVLATVVEISTVLKEVLWEDLNALLDERQKTHPQLREIVDSLPDSEKED